MPRLLQPSATKVGLAYPLSNAIRASDLQRSAGGTSTAALWNINSKAQLEKKAELKAGSGIPRSVLWHAQRPNEAITIEDGRWRLWNIGSTANVRQPIQISANAGVDLDTDRTVIRIHLRLLPTLQPETFQDLMNICSALHVTQSLLLTYFERSA